MKAKIFYLLFLCCVNLFAQEDYHTIDDRVIEIDEDDNYSHGFDVIHYTYGDNLRRVIEFDIQFEDGTDYDLTGTQYQTYQLYWNKVMKLETTEGFGTRNSIRLGWIHHTSADPLHPNKIELGFYGHMNHIQGPLIDDQPGREFKSLDVFVDLYEKVHVEMVLGKYDYYVRAKDKGIHVHRDIFSWNPEGEHTQVRLSAFYGDPWDHDSDPKNYEATEDMHFRVTNMKTDRQSYWNNNEQNSARIMGFMNSVFNPGEMINFYATDTINLSVKMEGGWLQARLPDEYSKNEAFTDFKPGSKVWMKAPEITLYPGTILYGDTSFLDGHITNLAPPMAGLAESNPDTTYVEDQTNSESELLTEKNEKAIIKNESNGEEKIELITFLPEASPEKLTIHSFPNPTNGNITFRITSSSDYTIEIIDIAGRVIFESGIVNKDNSLFKADLSNLENGFYVCKVQTNTGEIETHKIIKR